MDIDVTIITGEAVDATPDTNTRQYIITDADYEAIARKAVGKCEAIIREITATLEEGIDTLGGDVADLTQGLIDLDHQLDLFQTSVNNSLSSLQISVTENTAKIAETKKAAESALAIGNAHEMHLANVDCLLAGINAREVNSRGTIVRRILPSDVAPYACIDSIAGNTLNGNIAGNTLNGIDAILRRIKVVGKNLLDEFKAQTSSAGQLVQELKWDDRGLTITAGNLLSYGEYMAYCDVYLEGGKMYALSGITGGSSTTYELRVTNLATKSLVVGSIYSGYKTFGADVSGMYRVGVFVRSKQSIRGTFPLQLEYTPIGMATDYVPHVPTYEIVIPDEIVGLSGYGVGNSATRNTLDLAKRVYTQVCERQGSAVVALDEPVVVDVRDVIPEDFGYIPVSDGANIICVCDDADGVPYTSLTYQIKLGGAV